MYDLNDDSLYRAVHNELRNLDEARTSGISRVIDEDGVESRVRQSLSENNKELLRLATDGQKQQFNFSTGAVRGMV